MLCAATGARPTARRTRPDHGPGHECPQRRGRPGPVEEGRRAQQGRPGAGRQQLADRAPRLRQQLRRGRHGRDRIAEQEHEHHAEADARGARAAQPRPATVAAHREREQRDRTGGGQVAAGQHARARAARRRRPVRPPPRTRPDRAGARRHAGHHAASRMPAIMLASTSGQVARREAGPARVIRRAREPRRPPAPAARRRAAGRPG